MLLTPHLNPLGLALFLTPMCAVWIVLLVLLRLRGRPMHRHGWYLVAMAALMTILSGLLWFDLGGEWVQAAVATAVIVLGLGPALVPRNGLRRHFTWLRRRRSFDDLLRGDGDE